MSVEKFLRLETLPNRRGTEMGEGHPQGCLTPRRKEPTEGQAGHLLGSPGAARSPIFPFPLLFPPSSPRQKPSGLLGLLAAGLVAPHTPLPGQSEGFVTSSNHSLAPQPSQVAVKYHTDPGLWVPMGSGSLLRHLGELMPLAPPQKSAGEAGDASNQEARLEK